MNGFDLNLPDGWGVVLAAKIFGRPVPGRMANDDLTDDLFGQPAEEGWRVFLFGNAPGVAEKAAENVRAWYPGLNIAGTLHGHWADEDGRIPAETAERLVAEINDAAPDILHVGLGTPLQQRFVAEHRDRLTAPVIFTCGAYFEHLAERREYYPAWVLKLRIGFLYRLAREPRRLSAPLHHRTGLLPGPGPLPPRPARQEPRDVTDVSLSPRFPGSAAP